MLFYFGSRKPSSGRNEEFFGAVGNWLADRTVRALASFREDVEILGPTLGIQRRSTERSCHWMVQIGSALAARPDLPERAYGINQIQGNCPAGARNRSNGWPFASDGCHRGIPTAGRGLRTAGRAIARRGTAAGDPQNSSGLARTGGRAGEMLFARGDEGWV